ncbi:Transglutaminase-like superfamily protein [Lacunisphaera limnophila]|uniref:Transglutaminase-like superfamily protein n=1 Tax=Lacunisphaera limnophila TaxID=1838286 RepID=A0A1D8AR80_9BACT|nr:transglutaminase family protein [Lacunisphaera limnophila]AOS43382.1 Transglutaminase-like superfamily protein [Lacunisphaera limnophila]
MKLHVLHRTRFKYGANVHESFNEARLQPVTAGAQVCHSFVLKVLPTSRLSHYLDFHLNYVHLFEVNQPHTDLMVEANSVVTTGDEATLPAGLTPAPMSRLAECARLERCYDFLQSSTYVEVSAELWRLAIDATDGQTDVWQAAQAVMRYINREFRYQPAVTHAHTHMREVLEKRAGVCQDFAHVMLGLCRALKIPARYVSGYLYNGPADQLKGAQASHAWVEVYVLGHGWCGLDPTNNRAADSHYVKVATGRDFADVSPLKGTYRGTAKRELTVDVLVSRLEESEATPAGAVAEHGGV